jgi:hypothetical protein
VAPSSARTSLNFPETGAGTSTSTLSVVTSTMVSPTATLSPGCLTHRATVPSVTDSPIAGNVTSTAAPAPFPLGASGAAASTSRTSGAFASGAGTAAAAARTPFSTTSSANTAPTSAVSPACTRIRPTVPAAGDGISTSTLSVVTSAIVSPSATSSPSFLRHSTTVPSVTDSPIAGRVTATVSGTE